MSVRRTFDEFIQQLTDKNKWYRDGLFEVVDEGIIPNKKVRVKDNFGYCLMTIDNLLKGNSPSIFSAEDKTLYWIEQAKCNHRYEIDYSKTVYKDSYTNLTITCNTHGDITGKPFTLVRGSGCTKCALRDAGERKRETTEDFIRRATEMHGTRYGYSKVEYISNKKKVIITCHDHGDFQQIPYAHIRGAGCRKCYKGGDKDLWCNTFGGNNKGLLYVVEFKSEDETFIKVGITLYSVKERYRKLDTNMYNITTLYEVSNSDRSLIWDIENMIKNKYVDFKYKPLHQFGGSSTECFRHDKFHDILDDINRTFYEVHQFNNIGDTIDVRDCKRV